MPLEYERTDEELAERAAEAERDKLMAQRVREAEASAAAERKREIARIIAAMDLLDHANPMLLGEARAQRAVRNSRLVEQRPSKPSLGGLLPQQMEQIRREERSAEAAWQAEQHARARWVDDQEDVIKRLCAGQSEESQRLIRAQFNAQRARG